MHQRFLGVRSVTRCKIYGLAHPRTGIIRYVGKSVIDLRARLSNHVYKARSGRTTTPIGVWIRHLLRNGLRPSILLLENASGRWQDAERAWVSRLRSQGRRLLNVYPGGNGAHTRGQLHPQFRELLGKISDARIAELSGLCRETITYHRRRAGIAPAVDRSRHRGFRKGQVPHNKKDLPEACVAQLGLVSDRDLASLFGVSRNALRRRRTQVGVPAFAGRRFCKGTDHPMVKLTVVAVRAVRAEYQKYSRTCGGPALARKYGVDNSTINDIIHQRIWKGV